MIPKTQLREVHTSGVTDSTVFGISTKDSTHIMQILRDTLYSDKVLAVLREYSANAWDAHREAGKPDLPIKVTLPTNMDPTLRIRDYGHGLSHQAVFEVFTQYGASTKRGTNDAVGMLGIGSKSGFAYSDTFTITSWHGGMKRLYAAVLDPSDRGELKLMHEESCADSETGVEIQIAVKSADIQEFINKAQGLYYYFNPRPEINIDIPALPEGKRLTHGEIFNTRYDGWVAIMGCVAYRVNIRQLQDIEDFNSDLFGHLSGALYFDIGDVQVNASREELKYGDATKQALVEKLNALAEEYVRDALKQIESNTVSFWERRLKANTLRSIGMPCPKTEMFEKFVSFEEKDAPVTFTLQRNSSITRTINIAANVKLVIQDDRRVLKGFGLHTDEYIIKPNARVSIDMVRKELDTLLTRMKLTGIPIDLLSSRPWTQPQSRRYSNGSVYNAKHRQRCFRLIPQNSYCKGKHRPYSSFWEGVDRVPSDDDVFVILSDFQGVNYNFYDRISSDLELAKFLDIPMPAIYGYKTTEAKPIVTASGREYLVFSKELRKQAATDPRTAELLEHKVWSGYVSSYNWPDKSEKIMKIFNRLGDTHPVSRHVAKLWKAKQVIEKIDYRTISLLDSSWRDEHKKAPPWSDEAADALNVIKKLYPMLGVSSFAFHSLWGGDAETWMDYIELIDKTRS